MNTFFPNRNRKITFFVFTSIILHLLIFFLFRDVLELFDTREPPLKPEVWVQLQKVKLPQRIADIPKPKKEEVPDKASAQALYNQKVAQETVSARAPSPSTKKGGGTPEKQKKVAKKETPKKKKATQKKLKTKEELYAIRKPTPPAPKTKQIPSPRMPGIPSESPGPSPSFNDDYFPNYKIGNRTYLNTLSNPNIRYFVELKRKFKLTFNPVPALRGRINEISRGKIDVVLGVSVDRNGRLADLIVIRSSGIQSYDSEGIRTVRSSAPFSAPPANLLKKDGMIHMAWTFIVYL